jgi:menaquinone-dependent protoporphyrinogen oxidase
MGEEMTREEGSGAPTVLVSAGSKHGATAEIAARIGRSLARHGCQVVETPPGEVGNLDLFDAIVLGSAVYAGRWTSDAMGLAERLSALSQPPPTWIFSSGPVGDPPKPEEDPVDAAEARTLTSAREHRIFAGRIDRARLSLGEKAIVIALRAPEGDFRDWDAIDEWGDALATEILAQAVRPPAN